MAAHSLAPGLDFRLKAEPFPYGQDNVQVRFSDWKRFKAGHFETMVNAGPVFVWQDKGRTAHRQVSPGWQPAEIVLSNGERWSVYVDNH